MASPESRLGDPRTDDLALGRLLTDAHYHGRSAMNEALRPLGIEARHMSVLTSLDGIGPASQRRISDILGLDKSTMVRIMDELERMGLVTRTRAEHDRRAYAIELTDKGRDSARVAREIALSVADDLYGWLRPKEREQLVSLLTRLARATVHPGDE